MTEYDPPRRDGFVNRLEKETTSFFFTNFPEEVQVVELWSLFAKHGRVGEVYVPNKRDKHGNRFGFVKFKEIKSMEALSARLEDVWMGTFRLRVNLSLFGRNRRRASPNQPHLDAGTVTNGGHPLALEGGERSNAEKSFKSALVGAPNGLGKQALPTLEAEVQVDMMELLQGSYVGRLEKGVEVRALQVKLWLAGLHYVRAAAMGGGLLLLFRNSGEDVGLPAKNKAWWGGLLSEVRAWTPNQVGVTREIWLSIFGVPPHAWGETTFANLVNSCGVLVELDVETWNKSRFDVARVKIEALLSGRIDFSINLRIQGAKFVVRLVEEGGCLVRDDGYVEDQLRESEIGSSCATGGNGSVRAVLDGFDGEVSDSDDSEQCQQNFHRVEEEVNRSKGYKQGFEDKGDVSERDSERLLHNSSMGGKVMVTDDNRSMGGQFEVRGSDTGKRVDESNQVELQVVTVTSPIEIQSNNLLNVIGPGCMDSGNGPHHHCGVEIPKEVQDTEQGGELGLVHDFDPKLIQIDSSLGAAPPKKMMIENLDQMISTTRGNHQHERSSFLSEENQIMVVRPQLSQSRSGKFPKVQTPFPHMFGPRCLRFAGVINNSA